MRILFIFISVFTLFISKKNINYLKEIDNKIYEQYINNFNDYLYMDDRYELKIDKDKFKEDMSNKFYEIVISDDYNFKFKVHFKYGFMVDKEYYFYLEKNYEC